MRTRRNTASPKRILCVADVSIKKVIGGAERVLREQSTRLVRRGYEVHIMTRMLAAQQTHYEQIDGVHEWRYAIDQGNAVSYLVSTRENSKRLFKSLQSEHAFETVIFHQPFSAIGVIRSPLSRSVKKLYVCHSLAFEEFICRNRMPAPLRGQFLYRLQVIFRKYFERKVLKRSARIIVLSRFTMDKLTAAYGIPQQKLAVIPGGTDLEHFYPAQDKSDIRRKARLPQNAVILFSVRNFVARMGLENLIQALSIVVKEASDIYLVIGGAGPLKRHLFALAEELDLGRYIRFEGFIPEEKLPDYYRMADLFVLPTRELEGFGLVTLEALASGVPVVGTPVGGTQEILGKFDSSFMFKDSTPASMAELILMKYREIKTDPAGWQAIGRKCRRFVVDRYSWESHVDALEKLL